MNIFGSSFPDIHCFGLEWCPRGKGGPSLRNVLAGKVNQSTPLKLQIFRFPKAKKIHETFPVMLMQLLHMLL